MALRLGRRARYRQFQRRYSGRNGLSDISRVWPYFKSFFLLAIFGYKFGRLAITQNMHKDLHSRKCRRRMVVFLQKSPHYIYHPIEGKLTTAVLVGSVSAVLLAVAEESAFDAVTVTAGQVTFLTEWLVGVQERLDLALLTLQLAVLHRIFPVASLFLNVKVQTGWATDRLQALRRRKPRKREAFFNSIQDRCICP